MSFSHQTIGLCELYRLHETCVLKVKLLKKFIWNETWNPKLTAIELFLKTFWDNPEYFNFQFTNIQMQDEYEQAKINAYSELSEINEELWGWIYQQRLIPTTNNDTYQNRPLIVDLAVEVEPKKDPISHIIFWLSAIRDDLVNQKRTFTKIALSQYIATHYQKLLIMLVTLVVKPSLQLNDKPIADLWQHGFLITRHQNDIWTLSVHMASVGEFNIDIKFVHRLSK